MLGSDTRLSLSTPVGILTDEEKHDLFRKTSYFYNYTVGRIRATKEPNRLYGVLYSSITEALITKDPEFALPERIKDEIRRVMDKAWEFLQDLYKVGRELERVDGAAPLTNDDDDSALDRHASQLIIEYTKEIAKIILPDEEGEPMEWERVSIDEIRKELLELIPDLVLPDSNHGVSWGQFAYKGGVARLALKLLARLRHPERFRNSLLWAETPLADKDAIIGPSAKGIMWHLAQLTGVDADGIELRKNFTHDGRDDFGGLEHYLSTRDCTANQVLLTSEHLYFTPGALESALSGLIHSTSRDRSLFGIDHFMADGREYTSQRMLQRLIKLIIEGKATAFEIATFNAELQLGIYWLVLARKWPSRDDLGDRIARMFHIAKQMGQNHYVNHFLELQGGAPLRFDAKTPKEFMHHLISVYPKFKFHHIQTAQEISIWMIEKFCRALYKHLRSTFDIHPIEWPYKSTDATPLIVTLDRYTPRPREIREVESYIREHIAREKAAA